MSNEMIRFEGASVAPLALNSLDEVMRLGETLARSGFFSDATQAAQACVKILAGAELGMGPIASMQNFHVIKGKLTLGANALAQAVKQSGRYDYRVRTSTAELCEIEFFENGESVGVSPFTIAEARKAGTQNLDKFPRNMLFARAMSNGVRFFCPDAVRGTQYTPEEIADTDEPRQAAPLRLAPTPVPVRIESGAVALVSTEDADRIADMWRQIEEVSGRSADLNAFIAKKGAPDIYSLPADVAARIIRDLEITLDKVTRAASVAQHSAESGAALDAAIARAEASGIKPEHWQAEMHATTGSDAIVALTDAQVTEFVDLLNAWASRNEAKARAQQPA